MNGRQRGTLVVLGVVALAVWARCDDRPDLTPDRPLITLTERPAHSHAPSAAPAVTATAHAGPLVMLARDAVQAWQAPTVQERQERLTPLAAPGYLDAAQWIDPAAVPAAPIATTTAHAVGEGPASVDVTLTDGTRLVVDIVDGPLVADIRAT